MRKNSLVATLLIIIMMMLIGFAYLLITSFFQLNELQETEKSLVNEIQELGLAGHVEPKDLESKSRTLKSIEQTGYNAGTLEADLQIAEDFFEPVFTWKRSTEFEEVREQYVELLGEDNSFIKRYLEKTSKKSVELVELEEIEFIPLHANQNTVHYAALISYYINVEEVAGAQALETGLIKFKISGEEAERDVFDVEVWD